MLLIVMNTCPEGWYDTEYKKFKSGDDTSDSDTDSEDEVVVIRGYKKEKYKKILYVEELLPE
jgi:hypothetical protein